MFGFKRSSKAKSEAEKKMEALTRGKTSKKLPRLEDNPDFPGLMRALAER